jgi:hypothetical protein
MMESRHWADYTKATVDDAFVETLFELIEQISNDVDHPYHPPVIGVLVGAT